MLQEGCGELRRICPEGFFLFGVDDYAKRTTDAEYEQALEEEKKKQIRCAEISGNASEE